MNAGDIFPLGFKFLFLPVSHSYTLSCVSYRPPVARGDMALSVRKGIVFFLSWFFCCATGMPGGCNYDLLYKLGISHV